MNKTRGVIQRLVEERGFGFIGVAKNENYFFHSSALTNMSWEDLVDEFARVGRNKIQVAFEPTVGEKGPRAEKVEMVD